MQPRSSPITPLTMQAVSWKAAVIANSLLDPAAEASVRAHRTGRKWADHNLISTRNRLILLRATAGMGNDPTSHFGF